MPDWREPDRIVTMCHLVAIPRPGYRRPDLGALEKKIPGISQNVTFIDQPNLDISATMIREKVKRGEPINRLVPEMVAEYIKQNRLYLERQK